jgi:hypothetical protein
MFVPRRKSLRLPSASQRGCGEHDRRRRVAVGAAGGRRAGAAVCLSAPPADRAPDAHAPTAALLCFACACAQVVRIETALASPLRWSGVAEPADADADVDADVSLTLVDAFGPSRTTRPTARHGTAPSVRFIGSHSHAHASRIPSSYSASSFRRCSLARCFFVCFRSFVRCDVPLSMFAQCRPLLPWLPPGILLEYSLPRVQARRW